ncbi:MAG: peptidylprolyl isomerase [Parcubacteria group bacterium]
MNNMRLPVLFIIAIIIIMGGYFLLRDSGDLASGSPDGDKAAIGIPFTERDVVTARIVTEKGIIDLELYPKNAPKTITNFATLAINGFYDGVKFHRVVDDFVIQGGDPLSKTLEEVDGSIGSGGPGYTFEDEINPRSLGLPEDAIAEYESRGYVYSDELESLPMAVGALAMANAGPSTNGSQFFIITTKPQPQLTGLHTVFGRVVGGMDVVLEIEQWDVIEKIEIDE